MAPGSSQTDSEKKRKTRATTGKKCSNTLCISGKSERLISCNDCPLSYHFQCCDMNEDLYGMLLSFKSPGLKWSWRCASCSSKSAVDEGQVSDLKSQLQDLTNSIKSELSKEIRKEMTEIRESVTSRIDELETKGLSNITTQITREVECQRNDVREQINSYASTVKKNMDDNSKVSTKVNNNLQKMNLHFRKNLDREEKDVQSREKNLVFFNIPESLSSDQNLKNLDDLKTLRKLLTARVSLKKGDIINLRRSNPMVISKDNVPRPLIITVSDENKRIEILKLRDLLLKNGDDEPPIQIYCSPDRTKKQRELFKELRKTLKERRDNGETDLAIRNYKIIKIQTQRFSPVDHWDEEQEEI